MSVSQYLVALGSNQRHTQYGPPVRVLGEAKEELNKDGLSLLSFSSIMQSRPIGPSQRIYANAVALLESDRPPPLLLKKLKEIELSFGQRRGQKWSRRVLDLDIILWSGGCFFANEPKLAIPHPAMQERDFVLEPSAEIVPDWRDPLTGLTIRQLAYRLKRPKPLDPKPNRY